MNKSKVNFNKRIYIGFTVLDISKIITYDFCYNYMKTNFGDSAKLLYTDTDSLIYHITIHNFYNYIKRDLHKFDTSDYPPNNIYVIPRANKKALGFMKDECRGKIMTEFIGLRSKLYTYKILGEKDEKKKAKGVKSSTLKTITFDDYKQSLFSFQNLIRTQHPIRSRKHDVHSITQDKVTLSWQDDERKLIPGTTDTLPWGYKNAAYEPMEVDDNDM